MNQKYHELFNKQYYNENKINILSYIQNILIFFCKKIQIISLKGI